MSDQILAVILLLWNLYKIKIKSKLNNRNKLLFKIYQVGLILKLKLINSTVFLINDTFIV